jgi:hypothetical protein
MIIKDVVGPTITGRYGMACGDLGVMRWDSQRGCIAALFGDNFSQPGLKGDWRSPSIIFYNTNYNPIGVPDPGGQVTSLWPYKHDNGLFTTILPTDFIRLNGLWHVAVMITNGLGNELRTEFHTSTDLVTWNPQPELSLVHPSHPGNVMLTFDRIGDWVYIFGTGGLVRNKPVWLWRCSATTFPGGWWQPWGYNNGWAWGNPNENTPVLYGRYGELCFRAFGGRAVLAYLDAANNCVSAVSMAAPTDNLHAANRITMAYSEDIPNLYGPYISPLSDPGRLDGMEFFVSQWTSTAYKVMLLRHQTLPI